MSSSPSQVNATPSPALHQLADPKLERAEFLTELMRVLADNFAPLRQAAVLQAKDRWTVLIAKDPVAEEQERLRAYPELQNRLTESLRIGSAGEFGSELYGEDNAQQHQLLVAPLGTEEFPQVVIYLLVPMLEEDSSPQAAQRLEHLRSIMLLPQLRSAQRARLSAQDKVDAQPFKAQTTTPRAAEAVSPPESRPSATAPQTSTSSITDGSQAASDSSVIANQSAALVAAITGSIDKDKAAYEIANELCHYLNADRVSVIDVQGTTPKLLAASGVPSFDKRSPLVRATQSLVKQFVQTSAPVHFDGQFDSYPPRIQKRIEEFLDESMAQSFRLLPVVQAKAPFLRSETEALIDVVDHEHSSKRRTRAWILVEQISRPSEDQNFDQRWAAVQRPVTNQLINAKQHSELALLKPMQRVSKFTSLYRGHTARTAFGITLALIAVLALGFIVKTDFLVRCEGHVRSQAAQNVFVQTEGVVEDILVQEGKEVQQGEVLLRLSNDKLMQELAKHEGDYMQTKSRLDALTRKRHRPVYGNDAEAELDSRLLAEESAQLEETLRIQLETLQLTQSQISRLEIRAPITGVILGWNIDRRYAGRPLEKGTLLFSVADPKSEKQLDLKVPTKRAGYIRQAFVSAEETQNETQLRFSLASQPDRVFDGRLLHVNAGLEEDSDLGYVLKMKGVPLEELPPEVKNGIPVIAKVNCGRESFFYCKSYEFLDWLNRTTFEYF